MLLVGIGIPIAAGFIASAYEVDIPLSVLGASFVTIGIWHLFKNWMEADGFARSYAESGNWEYLLSHFKADRLPPGIEYEDVWHGPSQLDREDIVFDSTIGANDVGIYINIHAFGRIFIPWTSVTALNKHRIQTNEGWQPMVSVVLDDTSIDLSIPWQLQADQQVPKSVRIDQPR